MLRKNRRELQWIGLAFLLLCVVSAYRQISIRFFPADPARPIIVYFVYLLLLVQWWASTCRRIPKSNMRLFLLAEQMLILIGITTRFVQDALLYHDTYLMRVSGYWVVLPLMLLPIFGLFASLGLGKSEDYRISRRWYLILIPAGLLIFLLLTNERHHLIFRTLPGEVQVNLHFHPNTGILVILAGALILEVARIVLIYHRSREIEGDSRLKKIPFFIAIFMVAFCIPHFASSFVMEYELIEYTASLFFLEVLVWESCIHAGMVPVNTRYEEVFDRSTVAMRIVDEQGLPYLNSSCAPALPAKVFERLKQREVLRTPEGQELHLHAIHGGYAVWQNDVSQTIAVIDALEKSAEKLEQEGELLSQEIKAWSDEAAVKEQNRIYNQLAEEIGEELLLLRELLDKRQGVCDKVALFEQICLIGTYIKRRCNLRLIEQSDGKISNQELALCYDDLMGCLGPMCAAAEVDWRTTTALHPEFAIFTLDVFVRLLQYERFALRSIKAVFETENMFSIWIQPAAPSSGQAPVEELGRINKRSYIISGSPCDCGYRVSVLNGGD